MKIAILIWLMSLGYLSALYSQNLSTQQGTTRALVIGISNYQSPSIPDLRFSHRDVKAFVEYLKSPAGGNLSDEQIMLLINEQATAGNIYGGIDWLLKDSKKGDQVIVYYSGHGDVETKTKMQRGFLLAYDAPPANYWVGGTISLVFFQDIISELSSEGVQVTVYSDACHAGKLAGNSVNGSQLTATMLAQQFANEIKVLSCQANEYSLEGVQWGNGRGAFSFHLVNGLYGLADEDSDLSVTLIELENYLQDQVPKETAPHYQLPITIGNRWVSLARVDEETLLKIKNRKRNEPTIFSKTDPRIVSIAGFADMDSSILETYARFEAALENGYLLDPPGESAYDLYKVLKKEPAIASIHSLILRNLVAALQDDAHQVLLAAQTLDPQELDAIYQMDEKYQLFPQHLDLAAELLGPDHYLYKTLMSRKFYFEALNLRLRSRQYLDYDSLYKQAINLQLQALQYDTLVPHVFYELGLLTKDPDQAISYFHQAIALSSAWTLPYLGISAVYARKNQLTEAINFGEQAVTTNPEFSYAHLFLAGLYKETLQEVKCRDHYLKAFQIYEDAIESFGWEESPAYYFYILGNLYYQFGCDQKAGRYLEEAVARSNHFGPGISLAKIYTDYEYYMEADSLLRATISYWPGEPQLYFELGRLYFQLGRFSTAEMLYLKSIEINPRYSHGYLSLGLLYHRQLNEPQKAEIFFKKGIQTNPEHFMGYMRLGELYYDLGIFDQAEKSYLTAIQLKPNFLQLYIKLGEMYQYNLERYEEALQMYEKVREVDYYNYQANINLIELYRDHFKKTEAGKKMKLLYEHQLGDFGGSSLTEFDFSLGEWIRQETNCLKK